MHFCIFISETIICIRKGLALLASREIKKGIYWVGAVDWDLRQFHGPSYSTIREQDLKSC